MAAAREMGFENSCIAEVGRLLRVLAAGCRGGVIGEIGTGVGVGAAWIAAGMPPGASLVTVELDARRADAAKRLFVETPGVRVVHGDWHELLQYGPFAMLFADVRSAKQDEAGLLVQAMEIGGFVVLDDLTPEEQWPPEWRGRPDPIREFWLNDARLAATELLATPSHAVILATRMKE